MERSVRVRRDLDPMVWTDYSTEGRHDFPPCVLNKTKKPQGCVLAQECLLHRTRREPLRPTVISCPGHKSLLVTRKTDTLHPNTGGGSEPDSVPSYINLEPLVERRMIVNSNILKKN